MKAARESGEIAPELIDVFHEKGVFEHEETRRVLKVSVMWLRMHVGDVV